MLRAFGTEPILRIYAEARYDANAQKLLKAGVALDTQVELLVVRLVGHYCAGF